MTPHRARRHCRRNPSTTHAILEALESRTLLSALVMGKGSRIERHASGLQSHSTRATTAPSTDTKKATLSVTPPTSPAPVTDPAPTVTVAAPVTATDPPAQTLPLAPTTSAAAGANGQTVYADPRADINGDGVVDILDYTIIASHWQQTGTPGTLVGDVNGDGVVDILDATIVASNWQLNVAPPPVQIVAPAIQYNWQEQTINGVLNIWAPNPSDFGSTFAVTDPNALFGPDGTPQLTSIHQGGTADCYVLAAEGAMALETPNKIKSIVQNDSAGGWAVTFQFYNASTRSYVPVVIHTDDELSSTWQTEENGQVWDLVIEKAYAAFRTWDGTTSQNTMASLDYGYAGNVMTALGEPNSTILTLGTDQSIYNTIQSDLAAHMPVAMHTSATAPTMVQSHVYVITGVSTDASGTMWVTTYNPWGFYDTRTLDDLLQNGTGSLVVGNA